MEGRLPGIFPEAFFDGLKNCSMCIPNTLPAGIANAYAVITALRNDNFCQDGVLVHHCVNP